MQFANQKGEACLLACYNVNRFLLLFLCPFAVVLLLCCVYFDGAEIKDTTTTNQIVYYGTNWVGVLTRSIEKTDSYKN